MTEQELRIVYQWLNSEHLYKTSMSKKLALEAEIIHSERIKVGQEIDRLVKEKNEEKKK